jgi:ribosomal protein L40E
MVVGFVLFILGILLIVSHPILGFIPGVVLIVFGIVAMVVGGIARGGLALLRLGTTKTCPDCRSSIPISATVCRYCNHRFA